MIIYKIINKKNVIKIKLKKKIKFRPFYGHTTNTHTNTQTNKQTNRIYPNRRLKFKKKFSKKNFFI